MGVFSIVEELMQWPFAVLLPLPRLSGYIRNNTQQGMRLYENNPVWSGLLFCIWPHIVEYVILGLSILKVLMDNMV